MKLSGLLAIPALCVLPFVGSAAPQQDGEFDMAAMMAAAAKYTQPGENHAFLGMFVGTWDVEARLTMGGQAGDPERGTATTRWKIEGRVLESTFAGSIMGKPTTHISWLGYDNLKQSFVYTSIASFDTAMNRAEGDLTRDSDALVLYGTLDEYTTGEHDKMVKYVHHLRGPRNQGTNKLEAIDSYVLEVHDLAIGLDNTKVLEFTYTKKKK